MRSKGKTTLEDSTATRRMSWTCGSMLPKRTRRTIEMAFTAFQNGEDEDIHPVRKMICKNSTRYVFGNVFMVCVEKHKVRRQEGK